jgi:hypothetical protein
MALRMKAECKKNDISSVCSKYRFTVHCTGYQKKGKEIKEKELVSKSHAKTLE